MGEIKPLTLDKNPNHINEFLTHWTGRDKDDETSFNILCSIVGKAELKFGVHKTSFPDSTTKEWNTMISFTDTPLEQSLHHCFNYNFFGISFNKADMIEYGANPVLYLVDNRKPHKEEITTFSVRDSTYNLLLMWFGSVCQPYDPHGASYFYEREWRIIRRLTNHRYGPENTYNFKGTIRPEAISAGSSEVDYYLQFDRSIIENIIIPAKYLERVKELVNDHKLNCDIRVIDKPIYNLSSSIQK